MTKHFYSVKKLPIFLAISAVILIAGIVLCALFGFNYDSGAGKSFEVTYDAVVTISDGGDRVEEVCEETFSSVGIDYEKKYEAASAIDSSSLADTGDFTVRYLFGEDVSDETLAAVKNTVEGVLTSEFEGAEIYIAVRSQAAASTFAEPAWRGAVALAVAAVVVLVYIGFRFGWGPHAHGAVPHRARCVPDACALCAHPHSRGGSCAPARCGGSGGHLPALVDGAVHEDARDLQRSRLPHDGRGGSRERVQQEFV